MQHVIMANLIVRDCTPKELSPEQIIAHKRFARKWNPQTAELHLEIEERYADIAKIAQDESIDREPLKNQAFVEWFNFAEDLENQYTVSENYSAAVRFLKRLYTAHETLPRIKRLPDIDGIHSHEFGIVLRRLIEEL